MPVAETREVARTTSVWPARMRLLVAFTAIVVIACACGDAKTQQATPTLRPIPSSVTFPQEPVGNYKLGDPTRYGADQYGVGDHFVPLAGASVDAGRLGGSIYQIEVPDHWNGRLVMYVKQSLDITDLNLTLYPFPLRSYLIRNGYAWAESSGSSNLEGGITPEETAGLWDLFVQKHGRPRWTYLTGIQRSAVATRVAAARYPDRFDGALTLCGNGSAGDAEWPDSIVVAGAFAAGVTQEEFDSTEITDLINARIWPALADLARHARFEAIAIELSGGPRPFAHEGLVRAERTIMSYGGGLIGAGLFDNVGVVYHLREAAGLSDDEFNGGVVRRARGNPDLFRRLSVGLFDSFDLKVPLLTINLAGNADRPLSIDQQLRRSMTSAGSGDLLVQRTIRGHEDCWLSDGEWDRGLADLVAWVEEGKKPQGEDLLASDLTDLGRAFSGRPIRDSPEADAVPGADQRLSMSGSLTLDGQPLLGADVWVEVVKDGIMRPCMYWYWLGNARNPGSYRQEVAADAETPGCGAAGAQVYLVIYHRERRQVFVSETALDWPTGKRDATFDTTFSSAHPVGVGVGSTPEDFLGAVYWGVVLDASGEPMPPGTLVEAYIGDRRCGAYALPVVVMSAVLSDEAATYLVHVSGPQMVPGCTRDAPISFRVNGKTVAQTGKNTPAFFSTELDLKVED